MAVIPLSQPAVVCAASLDTKGPEAAWIRDQLARWGVPAILVDLSLLNPPQVTPDVPARAVLASLGEPSGDTRKTGRAEAVALMSRAFSQWLLAQHQAGKLLGVIGLGGSGGTSLIAPALRALPIGFPKVLLSTMASGNTVPIIGTTDIVLIYPVVDVAGINRVSRAIFHRAAAAMAGMVRHEPTPSAADRPTVGLTMFGVTTPCVEAVRRHLETQGWECLVFHATGTGGQAMENLVASGLIDAVLDITTTEVADEIAGGVFPGGPKRMDPILEKRIPYVVSAGAIDMVNFGALNTVPEHYRARKLHKHNDLVTLMRTTPEENRLAGKWIATKLAHHPESNWEVVLPVGGVSALDQPGKPFFDPEADNAFFQSIEEGLGASAHRVKRVPSHINDPAFAAELVAAFARVVARDAKWAHHPIHPIPMVGS